MHEAGRVKISMGMEGKVHDCLSILYQNWNERFISIHLLDITGK